MRAVLLSAGPRSLGLYPGAEAFDMVVAVNTAATLHRCDWWACADHDRFEYIEPLNEAPLLMMDGERDKCLARCAEKIGRHPRVLGFTQLEAETSPPPSCMSNTAPAALVLLKWLGAASIDVYGADMAGETDCTGTKTQHRNPARWTKELAAWTAIAHWLAEEGITVRRHQADAVEVA